MIKIVVVAAGQLRGMAAVLAFHRCGEVVAVQGQNFADLHFSLQAALRPNMAVRLALRYGL